MPPADTLVLFQIRAVSIFCEINGRTRIIENLRALRTGVFLKVAENSILKGKGRLLQ